jgi:hypothetical protein
MPTQGGNQKIRSDNFVDAHHTSTTKTPCRTYRAAQSPESWRPQKASDGISLNALKLKSLRDIRIYIKLKYARDEGPTKNEPKMSMLVDVYY